jgi:hypothetical protein
MVEKKAKAASSEQTQPAMKQRIRIRLKAYDHKVIDQSAKQPLEPELLSQVPFHCQPERAHSQLLKVLMFTRRAGSSLKCGYTNA